ncbi:hypothetical protein ABGB19_01870 [Mycobacterium sp. B14F4]|uniref:hypothetical protein n=1 Tax=Mycobacterium sp. B14F4 TaxID=3153565 RepID=UPI00325E3CCF
MVEQSAVVKWDDEVDVVCTGSGAAGLGSAIAVVELGGSVFVAEPSASDAAAVRPWLGAGVSDPETNEYFAALASDLGPLRRSSYDLAVPVRAVHQHPPADSGRTVAPFVGSRLRDWAARCLSTPYGYLYTRIPDWHSATVHTADGELVEVADIGTMTPDADDVGGSILDWLTAQACERDIELNPDTTLERIVFEEGTAVGAVFTTPDGPLAVRARHGVTVAAGASRVTVPSTGGLPAGAAVRVCLTGQRASRFGRLELLTSEPLASPVSPTCRAGNRRLWVSLHESHDESHVWRCGKVHGHPAPGQ